MLVIIKCNAQLPIPDPTELSVLIEMLASLKTATGISKETFETSRDMYEIWKEKREQLRSVTNLIKEAKDVSEATKKVAEVYGKYGSTGIYIDDENILDDIEPEVFEKFENHGRRIMDGFVDDMEELAAVIGKKGDAIEMNDYERLQSIAYILNKVEKREKRIIWLNQMLIYYVKQKQEGEVMNRLASGKF